MGADDMADKMVPTQQENNRLLLVVIFIIGVVSVIAIILASVSLSRKGTTNYNVGNSGTTCTGNSEKIWTFAIGHDGTNLEYIEDTSGTLRGFHVDIVNAVCEVANKNCRLMWDVYQNCWESLAGERARGGKGLMGRWYDACTGWFNTYDRALTVDFTTAFRKPFQGAFYTKKGNTDGFQWTDLTDKKIAFIDGWAQDEHCLARMGDTITGVPLKTNQILHYSTLEAAEEAVINGTVAAVLVNTNIAQTGELEKVSGLELSCVKDGGSMMMRKDTPLSDWWNPAFSRLKETNQYNDICKRVATEHGDLPGVDFEGICVD